MRFESDISSFTQLKKLAISWLYGVLAMKNNENMTICLCQIWTEAKS